MRKKILVTGGTGYIGLHTVIELLRVGYEPVIVDNLSNSKKAVLKRIEKISGVMPEFVELDIRDRKELKKVFARHDFYAVMHFAGLKAVGESIEKPLEYYDNNVYGSLVLFEEMLVAGVRKLVFSSSATVYGEPESLPYTEEGRVGIGITNPYGWTKYMIERIIMDLREADKDFSATILRYSNPIGADKSGLIGEDPNDIPNNLLPYVARVAVGRLPEVRVFGDDFETRDGTGVRDYIDVVDLALGHLVVLERMKAGVAIYNLGTGQGVSVLEVIKGFEKASGKTIPYRVLGRRAGDLAEAYVDAEKALRELGWKAEKGLVESLEDIWRWQSKNPDGIVD